MIARCGQCHGHLAAGCNGETEPTVRLQGCQPCPAGVRHSQELSGVLFPACYPAKALVLAKFCCCACAGLGCMFWWMSFALDRRTTNAYRSQDARNPDQKCCSFGAVWSQVRTMVGMVTNVWSWSMRTNSTFRQAAAELVSDRQFQRVSAQRLRRRVCSSKGLSTQLTSMPRSLLDCSFWQDVDHMCGMLGNWILIGSCKPLGLRSVAGAGDAWVGQGPRWL